MTYLKAGLISLAASAAFVLLNEMVLTLAPLYSWLGAAAIFLASLLAVLLLDRRKPTDEGRRDGAFNDNIGRQGVSVDVADSEIRGGGRKFSGNRAGGDVKFDIKNSDV